jgi:hypothetical protein
MAFESQGPAAIIAVIITFTISYLSILRYPVPDILSNALAIILGFYFDRAFDQKKPNI